MNKLCLYIIKVKLFLLSFHGRIFRYDCTFPDPCESFFVLDIGNRANAMQNLRRAKLLCMKHGIYCYSKLVMKPKKQ
jgi:hypothetical protein